MSGAWGSGSWGSGSWGGGDGLSVEFIDAQPIRENVVRVEFSVPIFFSGLLEQADGSRPEKWAVVAVQGTFGATGDAARAVRVARVELAGEEDGVAIGDRGRFVNLVLDRPMTPYPAMYDVQWTDVFSSSLVSSSSGTSRILATYRILQQPTIEYARPVRDFANPQVGSGAFALGTFGVGDDGDYAFDEGLASLKKRVLRRLMTRKGAFAHLPNYGVGVPDEGKKLGTASTLARLAADSEAQIAEEPDVERVRVTTFTDSKRPGLVFFRVLVKQREGNTVQIDAPFDAT